MPIRTRARILAFAACAFSVSAFGQGAYPTKPVRLIVPFAAGGSGDILGRLFAQRLTQQYGQQVLV